MSIVGLRKSANIDVELIIIDNASTDNTMSIAQLFLEEYSNQMPIGVYYENNVGKSYAINLAITKAKFNYILLCDDDNILKDDYLIESKKIIDQMPYLGVLGGISNFQFQNYDLPEWFNKYSRLYAIGVQAENNNDSLTETTNLWGAGMIFRKEIYLWLISQDFHLFSGRSQYTFYLAGEDYELCLISNILGFKNYYSPKLAIIHNINPDRIKWSYVKSLVVRNSLVSIYISLYHKFILSPQETITLKAFKQHLFYIFYKSFIRLFFSLLKHVIGVIMFLREGYSYQLDYKIALAEQKVIFNLFKEQNLILKDLIYKNKQINQNSLV